MKGKRWLTLILFVGMAVLAGTGYAQELPVKLGVLFVMSGPMGGYGKHGLQSVQMAVDEINRSGGILGRKVVIVSDDTKLNAQRGSEIAKRFCTEEQVDFIIGPTSSGIAVAVSKIAADHRKILILTQAAADSLTGDQFSPYQFATMSNAMMHARAGAYYVASDRTSDGCASVRTTTTGGIHGPSSRQS